MDGKFCAVGRFTLQPFRQLLEGGKPVRTTPKALAILSVLAEAQGGLVTKDELMKAVWPNLTVEENALQAHIAALRKILGHQAGLLRTVHGHGYRLDTSQAHGEEEPAPAHPLKPRWRGAHVLYSLGLALCVLAAVSWILAFASTAQTNTVTARIAILPLERAERGADLKAVADDLMDAISAELAEAHIMIAASGNRGWLPWASRSDSNVQFLLGGRLASDGRMLNLHLQLTDARENVSVWSGTFQEALSRRGALQAKVAAITARVSRWAVLGRSGPVKLDADNIAALIAARESISGGPRTGVALETENYRKILAAAPDFTWAHSGLAVGQAFQLRSDPANDALRRDARQNAQRALALDPHNGEAYVALELALPRFDWKEREALLLKGIAADPDFEPNAMMEARLLWSVGRGHDALAWFRRAFNLDPLHNDNAFTYAVSLAAEGHPTESRQMQELMQAKWPDSVKTRDAIFWSAVLSGDRAQIMAIADEPRRWPMGMNVQSANAWRLALAASHGQAARNRAIAAVKEAAAHGSLIRGEAMLLLSYLDDVDGAFAQARDYEPSDPRWGPYLFLAPAQAMRKDPRFMALASKFGFAAYWRSTGQWPDFCGARDLPYDCRSEVEMLAANDPFLKPIAVSQRVQATN